MFSFPIGDSRAQSPNSRHTCMAVDKRFMTRLEMSKKRGRTPSDPTGRLLTKDNPELKGNLLL